METFIPPGKEYDNYNVYEKRVQFNTLKSSYENGVVQKRAKWAYPLRTFVLQYEMLTEEEAEYILNFFIARKGSFESFYWTHKETQYTVYFDEDIMNLARFAYNLYQLGTIKLIQEK